MRRASHEATRLLFVVLAVAVGCRTAPPAQARVVAGPSTAPTPSRTSNVLGRAEIQAAQVMNAHEAITRLRPEFLRRYAVGSLSDPTGGLPTVYVNGVRQGGPDMLLTVPVGAIREIRYLKPTAAGGGYGSYNSAGVIAVRTER